MISRVGVGDQHVMPAMVPDAVLVHCLCRPIGLQLHTGLTELFEAGIFKWSHSASVSESDAAPGAVLGVLQQLCFA